jgi:CRP/FNR family cyclic AMP-dependent transcriptional regulator
LHRRGVARFALNTFPAPGCRPNVRKSTTSGRQGPERFKDKMRVDTEFPVVQRLMTMPRSGFDLHLRMGAPEIPSISELVEAVRTLNAADAFRPRFTAGNWRIVAAYLVRQALRSGDTLISQGEPGRTAFLVEAGTLLVRVGRQDGQAAPIALIRAGAMVGEPALFGEMPRMAQVDAISPCVVWALDRLRLDELLASHPALACELLRAAGTVMTRRVQAMVAHRARQL